MEPAAGEGKQEADSIDVGVIENQVGSYGYERDQPRIAPVDLRSREEADQCDGEERHERRGDERMGDVAMVMDVGGAAGEPGNGVDIGDVCGHDHDGGGARREFVKSGARQEQSHQ